MRYQRQLDCSLELPWWHNDGCTSQRHCWTSLVQARLERLVRDAEASEPHKQEVEAPRSESTAPCADRVTPRKVDDVDTSKANHDQPQDATNHHQHHHHRTNPNYNRDSRFKVSIQPNIVEVERPSEQEQSSFCHTMHRRCKSMMTTLSFAQLSMTNLQ